MEEELTLDQARQQWVERADELAKDPRLNVVPNEEYMIMFWELVGYHQSRFNMDEWTLVFLHSLFDRLEIHTL